uniref:Uncharacterized protein n=1 Tax=Oryza nivara TaxID=4536 RepID=A0A0E0GRI6_ORYNI
MPLLPSSASRASRSSLSVPLSAHGGPSPSGPVDAVGCPTPPRETMPSPSSWARRSLSSVHAASRPSGKKRNVESQIGAGAARTRTPHLSTTCSSSTPWSSTPSPPSPAMLSYPSPTLRPSGSTLTRSSLHC